jgi:predicted MFS family arabinose efflux permease
MGGRPRPADFGWRFTAALTLVMGMSVAMVPTIGVLGPFIIEHHGLSRTQIGLLASLVPLSGGLCAPPAGALVDRFGGRRLAAALLLAAAAALTLLAVAASFVWLAVASSLAGVALAIGNPATNQLIAKHIPLGRQGVIVGVKQSGVQVASFAAGAALPGLALLAGWRVAATSAASVGLLTLGVLLKAVPRDPPTSGSARLEDEGRSVTPRPRWPAIRYLATYSFFMGAGTSASVTYLPLYAYERLGLTATAAGAAASVMAGVAVFARIGWARIAERSWSASTTLLVIAMCAAASHAVIITADRTPTLLWVGAVGLGTSAVAWNGVAMLFVVRGAPTGLSGRFTGHTQLAFSLGMFSSPLVFGQLIDRTGSYTPGWSIALGCALVATSVALAGRHALIPVDRERTGSPT